MRPVSRFADEPRCERSRFVLELECRRHISATPIERIGRTQYLIQRGYGTGRISESTVGISSDTVGWIGTAHCSTGYGAPAFIMSSTPWMASSPPVPRIAAPRILLGLGVDDDLHEALRLALLDRAADAGHRPLADQQRPAAARACVSVMPTRPSGGSM